MVDVIENKTPQKKKKPARKKAVRKSVSENHVTSDRKLPLTDNPYVGISRSVATACIVMTALVIVISPSNVWILGPVIGAMAIFGIAMGYFSSK